MYEVNPDAMHKKMSCDDVQKIRDSYYLNQMTPKSSAPLASNQVHGPRTRRELLALIPKGPFFV